MKEIDRNYGIDLLRILSMLFVIIIHVLGHGGVLGAFEHFSSQYLMAWLLEMGVYCAVNCYALISGYVGYNSKYKYSNIVYLHSQVQFYAIIISVIFAVMIPGSVGVRGIIKAFFPVGFNLCWYFTAYFCLFFFIPYLNWFVEKLNKKQAIVLCAFFIILFSIMQSVFGHVYDSAAGYSVIWLCILYIMGACLRKYNISDKVKDRKTLAIYFVAILITCLSKFGIGIITSKIWGEPRYDKILVSYISPTIILAAVSLLLFFSRLKLKGYMIKIVSFLAPLSFGVYLIHDFPLVRIYLMKKAFVNVVNMNPILMVTVIIGSAVIIFVICAFIDWIRLMLFNIFKVKVLCEKFTSLITERVDIMLCRIIKE